MESKKSVLDTKPQEILGYILTAEQQIWVYFLVATGFKSAIYVFDLASGIAVVNEHYKAGDNVWGTLTLLLMYFPSLVFFIIVISRPDLWDEQDGIPGTAKWFGYRTVQFLVYPIWVMYRYAKQLFWSIEALLRDEKEREEALLTANRPSQTELYLFLQPFLQSIPQAFLQIYIMLAHYQLDKHISQMQIFCVTSSLMLVAHKTVSFLWFESQKILQRKEPWNLKAPLILQTSQTSNEKITPNMPKTKAEESEFATPFLQPRRFPTTSSDHHMTSSMQDEEENSHDQPTDTENGTLLPEHSTPPKPITNPEEIKVKRMSNQPSLPEDSAPSRPDSTNIGLPTRKIKKQLNGLYEEDALAKSVAFLWWFFFLFSRILSLASCANFQPYVMLGILVIHYIIIISHLLHQAGFPSIYKVFIQLCLGYVFTFCFIEFRYKLKNVTVFYICYFSLMLVEIIIMSLSWFLSSEQDGFWQKFVFTILFGSCAISFLSMALYFTILKPKVKIVYVEETSLPQSTTDSTERCCMCIPTIHS